VKLSEQKPLDDIHSAELAREKLKSDLEISVAQQQLVQRVEELKAEVEAMVNKANAVSPALISALQSFADKALAEKMAQSMAPMAILGGKSVADVFAQLLKGTVVEKVLTHEKK
jgi:major vault protein